MNELITALIVLDQHELFHTLREALEGQSLNVITASNCAEAALVLWSDCPPHLVFTGTHLADGDWQSVLRLATRASAAVNVVVVAPFVDISLYLQVIERGAFDFIVPPLSAPELQHVVRTAAENMFTQRRRRAAQPGAALPVQPEDVGTQVAVAGAG